jgi:hypothetical protein
MIATTTFNFKRRNLFSGPYLLGSLLVLAGLFTLISPAIFKAENSSVKVLAVGLGAIIPGLFILSSYGGTLIDFSKKRFKSYLSIGGFKFGEWTTLPDIRTIKVISTSYTSTNLPNGISPTFSGRVTVFKILLNSSEAKPVLSLVYSNKSKAVEQAQTLATGLKAELVINVQEE